MPCEPSCVTPSRAHHHSASNTGFEPKFLLLAERIESVCSASDLTPSVSTAVSEAFCTPSRSASESGTLADANRELREIDEKTLQVVKELEQV